MAEKNLVAFAESFILFKYIFNQLLSIYESTILSPKAIEFPGFHQEILEKNPINPVDPV